MKDYKYRGIWVDPSATDENLLLLDHSELELVILALNWAVEKSELKTGAQTRRLRDLEERMRELRLQRVDMVIQMQKARDLLEGKQ